MSSRGLQDTAQASGFKQKGHPVRLIFVERAMMVTRSYTGSIKAKAPVGGEVRIRQEFVSAGALLDILVNAVVGGAMRFEKETEGSLCGSLFVQMDATIGGDMTLRASGKQGGFGRKKVLVRSAVEGNLTIECGGSANHHDWTLEITGTDGEDHVFTSPGPLTVIRDELDDQLNRTIVIGDLV